MTAPRRRPSSANQLQRVVRAYAREYGLAEKRVRDWISYMVICGALERAGAAGQTPPHYVKGGIALELRLPGKARATRDLDVGFRAESPADLVRVLEDALAAEYEGFGFRRAREPHLMPSGAVRVDVAVQFAGGAWGPRPFLRHGGAAHAAHPDDYARAKKREKRGRDAVKVPLAEALDVPIGAAADDLLALDDAMARLEAHNERQCRVVECRCFAGSSLEETAAALGVSVATVKRDWTFSRAWLNRELRPCDGGPEATQTQATP